MEFSVAPESWFVNAAFEKLDDGLLDFLIEQRLQPEIGLDGDVLYEKSADDFKKVARLLEHNQLACTLHAPFFDLAPGAFDPKIRQISREKLQLAFELIPIFHPKVMVCHLGFESFKHESKQEEWFGHALKTWQHLLAYARPFGTTIAFENTYENNPEQHCAMLAALNSPSAGFCLDTGHILAFAKNDLTDWLPALDHLVHLHLHDNDGQRDSHLGVGLGCFDFATLFSELAQRNCQPTMTIEAHTPADLNYSLNSLQTMQVIEHP